MFAVVCVVGFFGFVYSGFLFVLVQGVRGSVSTRRKNPATAAAIVLGLIPGGIALNHFIVRPAKEAYSQTKPFQPYLGEYLRLATNPRIGPPSAQRPSGRMILVNFSGRNIDSTFFDLPDNLRATDPDNVGTVGVLSYTRRDVGHYEGFSGGGGTAYEISCTMSVYDKQTGNLLDQEFFTGSPPPEKSEGGVDQEGSRPTGEVINAIIALYNR